MAIADKALQYALGKKGCKYSQADRWKENPDVFDCSSLVYRAYKASGHIISTGSRSDIEVNDPAFTLVWPSTRQEAGQSFCSVDVLKRAGWKPQPGDLVFFNTNTKTTRLNKITHVVMVKDANTLVHARGTAWGVREDALGLYGNKVCAVTRLQKDTEPADTTPVTPAATTPAVNPTLKKGSTGAAVQRMQKLLIGKGQKLPRYGPDGDFGAETDAAVRAFQKAQGLTVDGIVGAKTWATLGV